MKILVTGGGSEEPIDNVRAVCNFSTGRTSAFLADYFAGQGHEVCEIVSERAVKAEKARLLTYKSFAQLADCLENECRTGSYDLIVHAAAVSDYSPYELVVDGKTYACGEVSKVPAGAELVVKMKKNPKLVDSLKLWSGDKTCVFAFKLTSNAGPEDRKLAVEKILSSHQNKNLVPDYVVSNDLSEIKGDLHKFKILNRSLEVAKEGESLSGLAQAILGLAGDLHDTNS